MRYPTCVRNKRKEWEKWDLERKGLEITEEKRQGVKKCGIIGAFASFSRRKEKCKMSSSTLTTCLCSRKWDWSTTTLIMQGTTAPTWPSRIAAGLPYCQSFSLAMKGRCSVLVRSWHCFDGSVFRWSVLFVVLYRIRVRKRKASQVSQKKATFTLKLSLHYYRPYSSSSAEDCRRHHNFQCHTCFHILDTSHCQSM